MAHDPTACCQQPLPCPDRRIASRSLSPSRQSAGWLPDRRRPPRPSTGRAHGAGGRVMVARVKETVAVRKIFHRLLDAGCMPRISQSPVGTRVVFWCVTHVRRRARGSIRHARMPHHPYWKWVTGQLHACWPWSALLLLTPRLPPPLTTPSWTPSSPPSSSPAGLYILPSAIWPACVGRAHEPANATRSESVQLIHHDFHSRWHPTIQTYRIDIPDHKSLWQQIIRLSARFELNRGAHKP